MNPKIAYSARREDLYWPAKNAAFFSNGAPISEAALCAEMSRLVYCCQESSLLFDRVRISAALTGIEFTGVEFFECNSSHGFFAHRAPDLGVIVLRGTDTGDPKHLAYDLDAAFVPFTHGRVHRGFANALKEIQAGLECALAQFEGRVVFTGHSLGAAMATLLASARPPDFLYTFGSPRVGDAEFVHSLQAVPRRRYVACCDLVTRVPLESFGYRHLGTPWFIDSAGCVRDNPDEKFIIADQARARRQYLFKYACRWGNVLARDLADHAPINYLSPLLAD